jgi:hypothetical protein
VSDATWSTTLRRPRTVVGRGAPRLGVGRLEGVRRTVGEHLDELADDVALALLRRDDALACHHPAGGHGLEQRALGTGAAGDDEVRGVALQRRVAVPLLRRLLRGVAEAADERARRRLEAGLRRGGAVVRRGHAGSVRSSDHTSARSAGVSSL